MPQPNHVLIIGGGVGGLCLAQGLRQAGVNATVYERDTAITDRLQGYRVHISPKGSRALHDCRRRNCSMPWRLPEVDSCAACDS